MEKKLHKIRDELSTSYALNTKTKVCPSCGMDTIWDLDAKMYADGFNAAVKHLEPLVETLGFYENPSNYAYNSEKSINYIWNDQGEKAKSALQKVFGE